MPTTVPDYELPPTLTVGGDDVHRALGDPRRRRILSLLSERAATARQLGRALDRSAQTVTHHLDVLAAAGLVRVVRTARVRATEQRWWGRTARTFVIRAGDDGDTSKLRRLLEEVVPEAEAEASDADAALATVRYARIPVDRAAEWRDRLVALADEFASQPRDGDVVHGILLGLFPTAWQPLSEE